MRCISLISGLLLAGSAFASNLHIQSAIATDSAGNPTTPKLGQPFWVTVKYSADTTVDASMIVATPWLRLASPTFRSYAGTRQATYGPVTPLYDGAMTVSVSLGDAGYYNLNVVPVKPSSALEYYDPQLWTASFQSTIVFNTSSQPSIVWAVPQPPTFGYQQMGITRNPGGQRVADGVLQIQNVASVSFGFNARTFSVRVNSDRLTAKFGDLKRLPSDVKEFTDSETYIESKDRNVKSFVSSVLPRNFSKTMTVYDAAKTLFQAVVGRITYTEPNGAQPSAVATLRSGYGDCGGFSSLFVAAARQAGIPARPITGFLQGDNNWHVWAEFYVPGAGWIPVDPSFADGLDPLGRYPLYFGVIPDLNQRVATAIGFDHSYSRTKLPMLQSPMAFTDSSKVRAFGTTCNLSPLGGY